MLSISCWHHIQWTDMRVGSIISCLTSNCFFNYKYISNFVMVNLLSLVASTLTHATSLCVFVSIYCAVSHFPPPTPRQTVLGQWSLCVVDIEQSLWSVIVLTAEPSLGARAGRHRYGLLHLTSRPLTHKCFSFDELRPLQAESFIDHLTFNAS